MKCSREPLRLDEYRRLIVFPFADFGAATLVIDDSTPSPAPDEEGNFPKQRESGLRRSGGEYGKFGRKTGGRVAGGRGPAGRDTAPTKPAKIKPTKLRIIGGQMRGRGVMYLGDRSTRPMKDSIRETVFNILGQSVKGTVAIDLFAGTGILAIESLSRGSVHAIAIEKSGTAAKSIRNSADNIGIGSELDVLTGDAFRIGPQRMRERQEALDVEAANPDSANLDSANLDSKKSETAGAPWIVYFCPPYSMWLEMPDKMFELIRAAATHAPPGSQLVVETDKFFDPETLPLEPWDIRRKGNVTLAFLEL